ncbi:MAG: hypothetical protein A3H98_09230 [Bacteroidetes bacterium RIFCSPLOWO2_02_FULL_36_8]|nr:MAG: hypothetical protein A3H98_09230 [Bacteroidetes bacterium RIFCSPLOWO2_02_FULL_36_8]OFY69135.1 MAG: hypothetical protein A3G23_06200 [Bacteroidetes bacterium RIFCSPLOWO2_12_FULL_37_12]
MKKQKNITRTTMMWLIAFITSIAQITNAQEITPEQFSRNPQLFYQSISENDNQNIRLPQGPVYNHQYSQLTRADLNRPTVITDNIDGRASEPSGTFENADEMELPSVITDNVDGKEAPSVITDNVDGKEIHSSGFPKKMNPHDSRRMSENEEVEKNFYSLKIPNVITPNGDGYNDRFNLRFLSGFEPFIFTIFNRWGEIIFRSSSSSNSWEGSDTNYQMHEGAYYYIITTSKGFRRSGLISLIR